MKLLTHITLPAQLDSLERLIGLVSSCASHGGFNQTRVKEIELATEEALVNIIKYAYQDKDGDIEVTCSLDKEGFTITIVDSGIPFNVLSVGDPDISADVSERNIGGLGIFLMKKLMDDIQYRRAGGKNILTLIAWIEPEKPAL